MTKQQLMEALEKQVRLLSECSENCVAASDAHGLAELPGALVRIADALGLVYL